LLHQLGFNTLELQKAVNKLGMVKRRQEERGRYKGSIVIDDFAHHPKAISLTVAAIKAKYPGKKIVTIFEPISATARSNIFQTEFVESLNCSDEVILAVNSLHTTIENSKNLDCRRLQEDLLKKGTPTIVSDSLESLRKEIDQVSLGDDCLLLILSNRTCLGLWESDFVKQLV
jgi:UDP-N-acetylmuramate: L-alanyl-gamma-D-glutamyl-meso-diaminopimelate ligase